MDHVIVMQTQTQTVHSHDIQESIDNTTHNFDACRNTYILHTVPEAANHIEDEDGNDEHASSITEWRERNNRRLGVCVSWLCAFVHVQSREDYNCRPSANFRANAGHDRPLCS